MTCTTRTESLSARRKALLGIVALPLLASAPVSAASTPIAEVKALLQAQTDAWNRGDIAGFCALYAEDCIFLSPSGVTRGRQTVQDRFAKKYGAAQSTMGQLTLDILDTRATADTVTLAMRWSLIWPKGPNEKPPAAGNTLIVWQRQQGKWRLVQDASM